MSTNSCISNYVDTMIPADSIDGFESDDDIFDQMDNNEDHILSNENITSYQRPETFVESSTTQEPNLQANTAPMNYQMPINYQIPINYQMPMNYQLPMNYKMQPSNYQMQLFSYVDTSQQQQQNTSNHATSSSTINLQPRISTPNS